MLLQSINAVQSIAECRGLCRGNSECAFFFMKEKDLLDFQCDLYKEEGLWACTKENNQIFKAYSNNLCEGLTAPFTRGESYCPPKYSFKISNRNK